MIVSAWVQLIFSQNPVISLVYPANFKVKRGSGLKPP